MNNKLKKMATPYLIWLYVLALAPAVFMFILMFLDTEGIDTEGLKFTFKNFAQLKEPSTIIALLNSLKFSIISTVICILLGYYCCDSIQQFAAVSSNYSNIANVV